MRLANFIEQHRGQFLDAWQQFVENLPPVEGEASSMNLAARAGRLFDALVADMRTHWLATDGAASAGNRGAARGFELDLARCGVGLTPVSLMSEFRALRAVILRLWVGAGFARSAGALRDVVRFNEVIDEAAGAAVVSVSEAAERERVTRMGIVAHDLRGPLHASWMALHLLGRRYPDARGDEAMGQVRRSLARMMPMVDDLLGEATLGMAGQLPLRPQPMELKNLAEEILAEAAAEFRSHEFVLQADGAVPGVWDRARLGQVVSNLVRNAATHGDASGVIRVTLREDGNAALLEVHNQGPAIPEHERRFLFAPAARGANAGGGVHAGLGLFIVQEIVRGHGGSVALQSSAESGTVFTVRLPRGRTA